MIVWVDAQLPPAIVTWLSASYEIEAHALRELGLRDATDLEIYRAAGAAGAVVMTKDSDFAKLQAHLGAPPKVIWLRCGNTSNLRLQQILVSAFPRAKALLESEETLVEITAT